MIDHHTGAASVVHEQLKRNLLMKINQSETAAQHFYDPETQGMLRSHEEIVFAILTAAAPGDMTLKEIACRFNEWTGYAVPDSSLCSPLAMLKAKGKITDNAPKRPCRVNGIRKKVWAAVLSADDAPSAMHPNESARKSALNGWRV